MTSSRGLSNERRKLRILIDTHFVIALADDRIEESSPRHRGVILDRSSEVFISAASLWEMEIKSRIGKLPLRKPITEWPGILERAGAQILPIELKHIFSSIGPEIRTRDPFDRLLLGVCAADDMRLVTMDRDMVNHPLAWRPFP
ncbi:MAG: type II toxin-antitoxin system VapC family toxin [Methylococcales bacterium]